MRAMADLEDETSAAFDEPVPSPRTRRWPWLLGLVALALALVVAGLWLARTRIAGDVIAGQLAKYDVPATYKIAKIGTRSEVLTDIVVGDPARPDLTIERAEIAILPRFGIPGIGRITLVRPRLYGSYHGGEISFGSLDKVLFTGRKAAFRLPDLDLALSDGRALLVTDYGRVGLKAEGQGKLRGGFTGMLAAAAPELAGAGCRAERASLYTAVTITAERPHLVGPLRAASLSCPAQRLAAARIAVALDTTLDQAFDGAASKLGLSAAALTYAGNRAAGLTGTTSVTFRKRAVTARYALLLRGVSSVQAEANTLALDGTLRTPDLFATAQIDGTVDGGGVRLANGLDRTLAGFQQSAAQTFAGPMLAQIRGALAREGRNSRLAGDFTARKTGALTSIVVPQASLRGGSGATLLALSRFSALLGGGGAPRLSGNFASGGAGLPQIAGWMERQSSGGLALRMTMAEYRAGAGKLAFPELLVVQAPGGALGFAGEARLSGPLPGGAAQNLSVPLDGNWSSARGLSLWRGCTPLHFDSLRFANLTLEKRGLTVCPGPDGAILRSDARGTRIAAGAPSLNVAGRLGVTPIRIASGAVGFAYPGTLAAKRLDISLGPQATATRFQLASLTAQIGKDIAGRFAGTDARLYAVPLDILGASGAWRYAGGRLTVADGAFRLTDRNVDARFQPLIARGASLSLVNNRILAKASLREPATDRTVADVAIRHDLTDARGHADLTVAGLTFDRALQPDTLTRRALGVIANARGTVRGTGQIDWDPARMTSSGDFSSDALDFAAAFGPVKGASGTVHFTDLVNLVTAPDQQIRVASINPGIAVEDGVLTFALLPGNRAAVKGATWPFMGGTLTLQPLTLSLGRVEVRRYVLHIENLDAAKFVERMELGNIRASGRFDGDMPLVFDENGGRIVGGMLTSRPPGGNVSYIGVLTYKDLSPIANFAFDALKSLDYRRMTIGVDGALAGDIVTRVRFDGVKQGAAAKRNIVTRAFANLPLQFNLNIRAPFYQLITSLKALYDPAFVRDPRDLGLIGADGKPLAPAVVNPPPPVIKPSDIQPSESGTKP